MVFFRPEKISTLNFSPECKSHITSLVGGGVVGEVIGEVVGEVRAWLLRNWEMEMTPGKLRNRNEWFLRKKKSGPEKGKDNFFFFRYIIIIIYIYITYIHMFQALCAITLVWFLGMGAHVKVIHWKRSFPEAQAPPPKKQDICLTSSQWCFFPRPKPISP